jgi:RNA polymerase sigma-70 factor (ECF subfamily)
LPFSTVSAPPAFRRQLLDLIPRLRRYARALTYDATSADDLSQQTLERALSRWQQFDPQREMGVWLLSIAHNTHIDTVRRESRMSVTDPDELQRVQDLRGADPGQNIGLRLDLQAALDLLPVEQREPLLLVCVEQFSYAEVAEVLHVPIGTVMSRVCRGRAALRKFLDGGHGRPRAETGVQLKRVV